VEYARNVLGIQDAEHEETALGSGHLVISRLACSLVGTSETITVIPGTQAHRAYGKTGTSERFACNYGLNPDYKERLADGGLKIAGIGPRGEVRLVELPSHAFFVGALFLPQLSSDPERPHPLIAAFLKAARDFRASRQKSGTDKQFYLPIA
jgi:CTP synthase (UTP-ammonia lyase)